MCNKRYFSTDIVDNKFQTNLLAADEYEKRLDNGCVGKGEGMSSLSIVYGIFVGTLGLCLLPSDCSWYT